MWLSLLTVIPSGNQELPAQVETWEGLEDSAGLPGPLPAAPRVPRLGGRELTHSPGNPSTWATERSICGMCWACNETFWRLCGKARMCTEAWSRADQCGGGAREIEFLAEGVASKLHLAPACSEALPFAHVNPGGLYICPKSW